MFIIVELTWISVELTIVYIKYIIIYGLFLRNCCTHMLYGPEWTSTHPVHPMWMDGALIGLSLFYPCAIPGWLFFLCPFSALFLVFLCNFIFSQPLTQFLFFKFFLKKIYSFWNFFHPPDLLTYLFQLKVDSSPIYLLTYKFKMCYPHPHSTTHPQSIYLSTNTLSRYLPIPNYMATPTYLVGTLTNSQQLKMMRKN
jgi:hypothetical protein